MSIYLSCNGVFAWGFLRFTQQSLDFFVKFDGNKVCSFADFPPESLVKNSRKAKKHGFGIMWFVFRLCFFAFSRKKGLREESF